MKLKTIFESLINERKSVGIVYHFTSFKSAQKIVLQDFLKSSGPVNIRGMTDVYVISTTRDRHFSNSRRRNQMSPVIGGDEILFVLDGNKMSDSFTVMSHDDTVVNRQVNPYRRQEYGDEMEEMWYGKKIQQNQGIKNLSKYIIKIIVTKQLQEDLKYKELVKDDNIFVLKYSDKLSETDSKIKIVEGWFKEHGFTVEIE